MIVPTISTASVPSKTSFEVSSYAADQPVAVVVVDAVAVAFKPVVLVETAVVC